MTTCRLERCLFQVVAVAVFLMAGCPVKAAPPESNRRYFPLESQRQLGHIPEFPRVLTADQFGAVHRHIHQSEAFQYFDWVVFEGSTMRTPGTCFPLLDEYFEHPAPSWAHADIDLRVSFRWRTDLRMRTSLLERAQRSLDPLSARLGRDINVNPRKAVSARMMEFYLREKKFFTPKVIGVEAQHQAWLQFLNDRPNALDHVRSRKSGKDVFFREYIGTAVPPNGRFEFLGNRIPLDILRELTNRGYTNFWTPQGKLVLLPRARPWRW